MLIENWENLKMAVDEELRDSIIRQIEFYFGDSNLPRDKFIQETMAKNDGWMPLNQVLQFKKMMTICTDVKIVVESLLAAPNQLIQVSECKLKIRRHPDKPIEKNKKQKLIPLPMTRDVEEMDRTLYVTNIAPEVTDELLFELFLQVGPLYSVRIISKEGQTPYGFVEFKHQVSVLYAITLLEGTRLFNKPLHMKPRSGSNTERDWMEKREAARREQRLQERMHREQQQQMARPPMNMCMTPGSPFGFPPLADPSMMPVPNPFMTMGSPRAGLLPPHMGMMGRQDMPEFALQPPAWMSAGNVICSPTGQFMDQFNPPSGPAGPIGNLLPPHLNGPPTDNNMMPRHHGSRHDDRSRSRSRHDRDHRLSRHSPAANPYGRDDLGGSFVNRDAGEDSFDDLFKKHRRDRDRPARDDRSSSEKRQQDQRRSRFEDRRRR